MDTPTHLSCAEFVELVTRYVEGALDPETLARFEYHLQLCPGCVTYVEQLRATVDQLGDVPAPRLSTETEQQLMAAFRDWHR